MLRYRMINRETDKPQTTLDKGHYNKKNELKTYKNLRILDERRLIRE